MKIINEKEFHIDEPTVVAIGKFDGIHLGHVELIKHILEAKTKLGCKSAVFTFNVSAASFFAGKDIKEITTLSEKRVIFDSLGMDYLVEFPLDNETAGILPEDFIKDIMKGMMNMKYIVAGEDVSYGKYGKGDADLLRKLSESLDYRVEIIDKVKYDLKDISSTYVRDEITLGHMDMVTKLLGHPYSFAGVVESGHKLGRTLGFPTMNLYPDEAKILPPMGVYYSEVLYEDATYPGLTNIGVRPTVSNDNCVSVETYLFDFDMDMYGKEIITRILDFKRPEIKFDSKEALKAQMEIDLRDGRKYHRL